MANPMKESVWEKFFVKKGTIHRRLPEGEASFFIPK